MQNLAEQGVGSGWGGCREPPASGLVYTWIKDDFAVE